MSKSLLDQMPTIVAEGKREAERIMERLESSYRLGLQTRELVIPSRDSNWQDMFRKAEKGSYDLKPATMNRLIYGDNLLAMAGLLAGDDETPSLRGKSAPLGTFPTPTPGVTWCIFPIPPGHSIKSHRQGCANTCHSRVSGQ